MLESLSVVEVVLLLQEVIRSVPEVIRSVPAVIRSVPEVIRSVPKIMQTNISCIFACQVLVCILNINNIIISNCE